jgi:hypothetical protein
MAEMYTMVGNVVYNTIAAAAAINANNMILQIWMICFYAVSKGCKGTI